jgi:cysteine-rich repeat protein
MTASGHIVDGENKGIIIQMDPAWFGGAWPPSSGCTGPEGEPWPFNVVGANSGVQNLTVRYWGESLQLQGSGAYVDNVTCIGPADDCFSNPNSADVIIRNSTVQGCCDKGIQVYGDNSHGSANYDTQIINTTISYCNQPIRLSLSNGRHYVENTVINNVGSPNSFLTCVGPRYTGGSVAYWKNVTLQDCQRGLRIGSESGDAQFVSLGGNRFESNDIRGAVVYQGGRALFTNDTFINNGGQNTGGDPATGEGGVVAGNVGTPYLDAGGGSNTFDNQIMSSTGGNTFTNNVTDAGPVQDVTNQTATTVKAEGNCWGDANPADQISGSVDWDPVGSCGVAVCGNGTTESPEVCDDGNTVTETACAYGTPTCTYCNSTCAAALNLVGAYCGDSTIDSANGEMCDTAQFGSATCGTKGCSGGSLTCSSSCVTVGIGSCTGCVNRRRVSF